MPVTTGAPYYPPVTTMPVYTLPQYTTTTTMSTYPLTTHTTTSTPMTAPTTKKVDDKKVSNTNYRILTKP